MMDAYSDEWAEAFCKVINESSVYKEAAKGWEGSVGLVVLPERDKNFPDEVGVFLDLWHGEARDVKIVGADEARAAQFVITAAYSRWKQVAMGELDATRGMMAGKLKLKGNFALIVRYASASKELTRLTQLLPTIWPDEVPTGASR